MSATSTKKVLIYRFDREAVTGFLDSSNWLVGDNLQLLNPSGVIQNFPISQVRAICFVREWFQGPAWGRNQYSVRPRQQGLWVRLRFRDGESLEATMPNSVALFDPVAISISPPEPANGVQRLLIPRAAIDTFEILGVVGSPLRKPRKSHQNQLSMFD